MSLEGVELELFREEDLPFELLPFCCCCCCWRLLAAAVAVDPLRALVLLDGDDAAWLPLVAAAAAAILLAMATGDALEQRFLASGSGDREGALGESALPLEVADSVRLRPCFLVCHTFIFIHCIGLSNSLRSRR